jgi:hypothetical protein
LAANAFVLVQIYQHHSEIVDRSISTKEAAHGAAVMAVMALIGMAASYLSLCLKPKDHPAAVWSEIVSVIPLGFLSLWYVMFLLRKIFF